MIWRAWYKLTQLYTPVSDLFQIESFYSLVLYSFENEKFFTWVNSIRIVSIIRTKRIRDKKFILIDKNIIESLSLTINGKFIRNKLPVPERKLRKQIWCEVSKERKYFLCNLEGIHKSVSLNSLLCTAFHLKKIFAKNNSTTEPNIC